MSVSLVHGVSSVPLIGASEQRSSESHDLVVAEQQRELLRQKYVRANALVASILNKYYNGSSRAVDPFVIRYVQEEETRLFSIQCYIEEGPTEQSRERKESIAMRNATRNPSQVTLLTRLLGICGGYLGGPGSVMRQWDSLSASSGQEEAMFDYIAIVDKILPGWDHALEYPIAKQDRFWKDDTSVAQCQFCAVPFTLPNRRHHCRMCLDIFCAACCNETLEMALCPGAPLRPQRVCAQCYEDAEKDKSLLEIRRMLRANHEIEQHIRDIQTATEAVLAAKQREEAKLRSEAAQCGCDMAALDTLIQQQIGGTSPIAMAVKLPPSHKFTPRESVEAIEQVALANRQLLMALKVAQCRSKRALEQIEMVLTILRQAICFGSSSWNVVLRRMRPFLTLRDIKSLAQVSHALRSGVERYKCERKCILAQDLAEPLRPFVWQAECLKDDETRRYITDLAEAIRTRVESSDSETEDDSEEDRSASTNGYGAVDQDVVDLATTTTPPSALLTHSLLLAYHRKYQRANRHHASSWETVYAFILLRCASAPSAALEFDAQIQSDVNRTFGVSSLRKAKKKTYQCSTTTTSDSESGVPLATRKTALTNVLRAFSSVNTEIGYCQGMDHVAALLLSVVDWNESRAFWLLTSLVVSPRYQLDLLYCPGIPHLNLRFYQLEKLMDRHLPELFQYFQEMEYPVSMFSTGWFMTLFTNMDALSYDLVLRVFDGFLVSGWKQIFRLALVILEALQHNILASSFEEIPQLFYDIQTNAPILGNVRKVLAKCMQFKVTNAQLRALEQDYDKSVSAPSAPTRKAGPRRPTLPTSQLASASSASQRYAISQPPSPEKQSPSKQQHEQQRAASTSKIAQLSQSRRYSHEQLDDSAQKSPDTTRAASPSSMLLPVRTTAMTPQAHSLGVNYVRPSINASNYF